MVASEKVLVTGAAGHVGGRTCRALTLSANLTVRAAHRSMPEPRAWAERNEVVVGDIADPRHRTEMLDRVGRVVHLATRGYSAAQPPSSRQLDEDRTSTIALASDAAARGVRRFVYVSSLHVYGQALAGAVNEGTPPRPDTPYGESRWAIEGELAEIGESSGMEVAVVRMSNAFGVPEYDRTAAWSLLIHDLCRQACHHGRLRLRSNGRAYRNVIALRDAVEVLVRIVEADVTVAGTYLLAGPETLTVREIATMVADEAFAVFGAAPTVEVDDSDMARYEPFHLEPENLRALGIAPADHRRAEIRDLLHYAHDDPKARIGRPGAQ